jgi:hypothetical protein
MLPSRHHILSNDQKNGQELDLKLKNGYHENIIILPYPKSTAFQGQPLFCNTVMTKFFQGLRIRID